jgi:class 3 adenylate cyclase
MDPLLIGLGLLVIVVVGVVAYMAGSRRAPTVASDGAFHPEQRLEEYEFYPFIINPEAHVEFSAESFDEAVQYFLEHRNELAARELIVIGEQNLVRDTATSDALGRYKELYRVYDGDSVISDNEQFLDNYKRIVNQIGRSFPNTGIEILLHNLVNPSRSLVAIENGEVTGRSVGSGATNLVLDLKTRRQRGEDKVNYELNIGSRQFKCTTVPIFRPEYGLVGAVCINVDTHFLREDVKNDAERLEAFFDNLLRTDFQLDENILSKDEYRSALNGKRHYLDEAIRSGGGGVEERQLAAIMFSDIVDFTALMGRDESTGLAVRDANAQIHRRVLAEHRGRLLKDLGDGFLASFGSVSSAVASAQEIQRAVAEDGRYQIRIGIHLGEVIAADGDVYGDGVNIASRIEGVTPPGGIGVSAVVYDNIKNREGLTATLLGKRELKNVAEPITLYTIDASPGR